MKEEHWRLYISSDRDLVLHRLYARSEQVCLVTSQAQQKVSYWVNNEVKIESYFLCSDQIPLNVFVLCLIMTYKSATPSIYLANSLSMFSASGHEPRKIVRFAPETKLTARLVSTRRELAPP